MGVRGVIAVAAAVLVSLVGAGSSLAATGIVAIELDLPKGSRLPASVLAYPLDPAQQPVGETLPKGTATLRLEAGLWVVATSTPTGRGKPRLAASLVAVRAGRRTPLATSGAPVAQPSIAVGEVTTPIFLPQDRESGKAIATAELAKALRRVQRPCTPGMSANPAANPLWSRIRSSLRSASRSGPRAQRDAARAALDALNANAAAPASLTLSGTMTPSRIPSWSGTFRLTSADGTVVLEKSYTVQRNLDALFELVAEDAIDQACKERRRIQVDATIVFDTTNRDVRMTAIVDLKAIGIERVGTDGKVEKGGYEFETPTAFTVRDPGVTGLSCTASITQIIDASPPLAAPSTLAVERRDGTFQVFIVPGLAATYSLAPVPPCSPTGSIQFTAPAAPGLNLDVPGVGTVGTKTGTSPIPLPGLTGTYSAEVRVTRLPSTR